jgi:hypothetical protein
MTFEVDHCLHQPYENQDGFKEDIMTFELHDGDHFYCRWVPYKRQIYNIHPRDGSMKAKLEPVSEEEYLTLCEIYKNAKEGNLLYRMRIEIVNFGEKAHTLFTWNQSVDPILRHPWK